MAYSFLLTTLAGAHVSELPLATGKRFGVPILGMGNASLGVPASSTDADFLLEGDALLKVYEVDDAKPSVRRLLGHHRLVTAEEVGGPDGVTVAATFADPYWVLLRRLLGKAAGGYSRGTSLALVDRGTIISELVAATNAEGASGVRMGTLEASSSTYVAGWFYKPVGEAIAELCATIDGPDWRVRPIEYSGGYYGELDVLASMSVYRPDAVFEFGEGLLNVRGFKRAVSLEGTLNRVLSLPSGFPDNALSSVLQRDDATSQGARGLLEGLVPGDLTVDAFRAGLLDQHLAIRKGPRQTITFEPVRDLGGRVPRLGLDFNVGDVVPFRATISRDGQPLKRLDVLVRVYNYELAVDELGVGTAALTVTPS